MKKSASDIALRIHIGLPEGLIQQVAEGVIDIAIMYTPKNLPGLRVEKLLEEKLVLVTTDSGRPSFTDTGIWGLSYILEVGGSGYFRLRAVRPYLDKW